MNNVITVQQLPIIAEQLQSIKAEIAEKVGKAKTLVCTPETIKDLKAYRADINKLFDSLETQRKAVKNAIIAPYNEFDKAYKECVTEPINEATTAIGKQIADYEGQLKDEKTAEVKALFEEYAESQGVGWLTFESAKVNVTLTASMKSLKDNAKAFVDRIVDDIVVISRQPAKDEIFHEYQGHLNLAAAIQTVTARHEHLRQLAERKEADEAKAASEQQCVAAVEALAPPVVEPEPEDDPVKMLSFNVKAPVSKLKALKKFLDDGGYEYGKS